MVALSEDGRTVTVKLRAGIRWSDGEPLTSDDFVFTFNRIWLDKDVSPVTSLIVLGGKIVKVDDLTFQYVFADPNPSFINLMANMATSWWTRNTISGTSTPPT